MIRKKKHTESTEKKQERNSHRLTRINTDLFLVFFNAKHETQNTKHLRPTVTSCENKGFTLVEIVVSITILAIAFLSLYQFFFKSYAFSSNIRQKEIALLLAQKKAEHTLAGIESENDTITIDTLDSIVYKTILKTNEEIPPSCSINVYVHEERIMTIQMLKP